jgi:uncharacterized membrane protein HdeD (DUF308 family)
MELYNFETHTVDLGVVHRHWKWFLGIGIALALLGVLALSSVVTTTFVSVLVFGWILIATSVLGFIHLFKVRAWSGFFINLLLAILDLVIGVLLIARPTLGALSLTLVMGILFFVGGLYRVSVALTTSLPHRTLLLFNGFISILLGALIVLQWPVSGLWVIGLFLGVDLVFRGISLALLAVAGRNAVPASKER